MSPFLIKLLAGAALIAGLTTWGLLERSQKVYAQAQNVLLQDDIKKLGDQVQAANDSIDRWKQSAQDAQKDAQDARQKAAEEARKHKAALLPIQVAIEAPTPPQAGCDAAWDRIEGKK